MGAIKANDGTLLECLRDGRRYRIYFGQIDNNTAVVMFNSKHSRCMKKWAAAAIRAVGGEWYPGFRSFGPTHELAYIRALNDGRTGIVSYPSLQEYMSSIMGLWEAEN